MKKKIVMLSLVACLISVSAFAEKVKVAVDGMVCAFCAQGIEKKFKADPAVESCKVDLEKKEVEITLKKDQKMTDEKIKKTIKESGYNVHRLERFN
jgi:copper chaperone CopZ